MNALEHRIPPPILLLLTIGAMWFLSRFGPRFDIDATVRLAVTASLVVAGFLIDGLGLFEFRRARTTINPVDLTRSTTLVTRGIYQWTRNPMYVGMVLVLFGASAWFASAFALAGPIFFGLFISRFQIVPEERVLVGHFGEPYLHYQRHVRRWV